MCNIPTLVHDTQHTHVVLQYITDINVLLVFVVPCERMLNNIAFYVIYNMIKSVVNSHLPCAKCLKKHFTSRSVLNTNITRHIPAMGLQSSRIQLNFNIIQFTLINIYLPIVYPLSRKMTNGHPNVPVRWTDQHNK